MTGMHHNSHCKLNLHKISHSQSHYPKIAYLLGNSIQRKCRLFGYNQMAWHYWYFDIHFVPYLLSICTCVFNMSQWRNFRGLVLAAAFYNKCWLWRSLLLLFLYFSRIFWRQRAPMIPPTRTQKFTHVKWYVISTHWVPTRRKVSPMNIRCLFLLSFYRMFVVSLFH